MEAMHLYQVRRLFTAVLAWLLVVAHWRLAAACGRCLGLACAPSRTHSLCLHPTSKHPLASHPLHLRLPPFQDLFVPKKMRC